MKKHVLLAAGAAMLAAACSKTPPPGAQQPAATAQTPAAGATAAGDNKGDAEKVLSIYNWSDYIAPDTIANFEKETGIKVIYDTMDSNDTLEAKLMSGNTGYDLVVPSLQYLARQAQAGVYMPLDKSKLSNWSNLDPEVMSRIASLDPDNKYAVNWQWGTTGIGYNVDKVKAALGENAPTNSWDLVFKPEYASKLKDCGITMLDAPDELLPIAMNYAGVDPHSFDPKDIEKGEAMLKQARPFVRYFHSSKYIDDLANGGICVAVGWSGDAFIAKDRAEKAKNGVHLSYSIPKEGAPMWFDMMAIPKDAKHPNNAHLFLNYIMRPKVMADITNAVTYANANAASKQFVDKAILENPNIYPQKDMMAKLFTFVVLPPEVDRLYTRFWTTLKTGK